MKVLVACEESQAVTKELRRLGHEAYSCDIMECSGGHPEWHICGDVLPLLNGAGAEYGREMFCTQDNRTHVLPEKWDMIIAFPPCTYLTKAGACRLYKEAGRIDPARMEKAVEARLFFQRFIDADCDRIAVENPTPMKVVKLPPPTQIIQPYEYGHPYSKRTCLWLKGLPQLEPTMLIDEYTPWMPSNTGGYSHGRGGARGIAHDPVTASKTFHGIARAMAEQWAGICEEASDG